MVLIIVNDWSKATESLNKILCQAIFLGGNKLLLQSREVNVSSADVKTLSDRLSLDTLVVGAKMISNHGGAAGVKKIDGINSPWNTLALWNLSKLKWTGFIEVSNEKLGIPSGMEEVITISILQQLYPNEAHAKLVELSKLNWRATWNSKERQKYHQEKMSSKLWRAEMQLKHSKVKPGVVTVL